MRDGDGQQRGEFGFLVGRLIDQATLDRAESLAPAWGVAVHDVLFSMGWVTPHAYAAALATDLGISVTTACDGLDDVTGDRRFATIDAASASPDEIRDAVQRHVMAGMGIMLAIPERQPVRVGAEQGQRCLAVAVDSLRQFSALASARGGTWLWQKAVIAAVLGSFLGMAAVDPPLAYFCLTWVAAIPFAVVVAQRLGVLLFNVGSSGIALPAGSRHRPRRTSVRNDDLPVYSILVPLFREVDILPDLVAGLAAIDYPPAKLDILLILEEVDVETRAVAETMQLPPTMRVITVPDAQPRTKPKAMNYALQFAKGEFVTVYDAEDIPDRLQLRDAQALFQAKGERLGCVQAKLNIHNRRASWFTRGIMAQTPQT